MFSLLNPSLLFGLIPLVGIPLAVHLFNKKFPKKILFPDIRIIKTSLEQRSKLFRLRHIILMILRSAALLLLLFCFLQPILSKFAADTNNNSIGRNIIIVLDNSLSMSYRGGSISSSQRGLIEIEKIVDSLSSSDEINLIVADQRIRKCFEQPTTNHSELLAFAQSLTNSLSTADLNNAARAAAKQLRKNGEKGEIYFISDFQRSSWGKVDLSFIDPNMRLFYVDVAPDINNNRAIIGIELKNPVVLAGSAVPVAVKIANYSEKEMSDRLEIRVNDGESLFYDVEIAPWNIVNINVSIPLHQSGLHQVKAILSNDDLPEDNQFFFTLKAQDKEEVLIISDTDMDRSSANFILDAALNPYRNRTGSLLPKAVASTKVAPLHLTTTNKVFLTGIGQLNSNTARMLADFMKKGGSVIYFIDSINDEQNLKVLAREMPVEMPFTTGRLLTADNIPGGCIKIRSGHFQSKFLRLFRGDARQRLGQLDFYEYHQARSTANGQVLLTYAEGTPAMATCSVGLGQLLLCNFSVKENGSNIASRKIFPAWIHEISHNLSRESKKLKLYEVGDRLHDEVWLEEIRSNRFVDPENRRIKVESKTINDSRLAISFIPQMIGHYSLYKQGVPLYSYAINCNPDESDLRVIDVSALQTADGVKSFKVKGKEKYAEVKAGQKIFHWFLIACLLLLMSELFLFHFFKRFSI